MDRFEMAETLRKKAGVTYAEARRALEENEWDMLRAMVALEAAGKVKGSAGQATAGTGEKGAENGARRFVRWLGDLIHKGNRNYFRVSKDGRQAFDVPVTVAALLLLLLHGLFLLAVLVGLLAGYRAKFVSEKEDGAEREAVRAAGQAAEDINGYHAVNSL